MTKIEIRDVLGYFGENGQFIHCLTIEDIPEDISHDSILTRQMVKKDLYFDQDGVRIN